MFSIQFPIFTWIFLGIEIVVFILMIIYALKPMRLLRRLPIDYSFPIPTGSQPIEEEGTASGKATEENISDEAAEEVVAEIATEVINSHEEAKEGVSAIETEEPVSEETGELIYPKVSVVVYSSVDEDVLTAFLEQVLMQNYPDFEVIVVCDASFEATGILSEKYEELFKRVYVTFIPPGSHNLSRRKLALTLGIKAAKGEIILTTVANAEIPSENWISAMTAPFISDSNTELTLGYTHPEFNEINGPGRRYKEFFHLLASSQWIGYALMGKVYRGDGFNLAFLRSTFFREKGYSKTMHLHSGEDDLFVHSIATPYNTAVVVESDSILTTKWGEGSKRIFNLQRSQYDFTARWLPLSPFVRSGWASTSQWLVILAGLASSLIALPNIIPAIVAFVIWIAFIITETSIVNKAAGKLHAAHPGGVTPIFWLIKPLNNLWFRATHRSSRFKNFTWQRHKHTK